MPSIHINHRTCAHYWYVAVYYTFSQLRLLVPTRDFLIGFIYGQFIPACVLFSVSDPDTNWIRIALGQRSGFGNLNPDPGRPKLSPRKGIIEEMSFLKSLNVLSRGLTRH
jgi:hypothetical protein